MKIEFLKPARMDDILDGDHRAGRGERRLRPLHQPVMRGDDLLVEAHVRVAFVSGGRARPIPKPLRIAMKADQDALEGSG